MVIRGLAKALLTSLGALKPNKNVLQNLRHQSLFNYREKHFQAYKIVKQVLVLNWLTILLAMQLLCREHHQSLFLAQSSSLRL